MPCPACGNNRHLLRRGSSARPGRYQCPECQTYFTDKEAPKILVLDIETLPLITTSWEIGHRVSLSYKNVMADYAVLSWSALWLGEDHVMGDIMTSEECQARINNIFAPEDKKVPEDFDRRIVERMWTLLDEADMVVHQNGHRFDEKKLNYRFLYYGMPPYTPFTRVDTYEIAQKIFSPTSGKQDAMLKWLGLGSKLETDYELWLRCQIGEQAALDEMLAYNKHDVITLTDYYLYIRAWAGGYHPNLSVYTQGVERCGVCRAPITTKDFLASDKLYHTTMGNEYRMYRCPHCGSVGRRGKKANKGSVALRPIGGN